MQKLRSDNERMASQVSALACVSETLMKAVSGIDSPPRLQELLLLTTPIQSSQAVSWRKTCCSDSTIAASAGACCLAGACKCQWPLVGLDLTRSARQPPDC